MRQKEVKKPKPIIRDERLYRLSHDHHGGLVFSLRLKKGAAKKADLQEISAYIKYFWENDLKRHFDDEERLLLPCMSDDDDLKVRTLNEHEIIFSLVQETTKDAGYESVLRLSKLVNDHIRFEERVLFPYLEETLDNNQLNEIGEKLREHPEFCDDWTPAFWK